MAPMGGWKILERLGLKSASTEPRLEEFWEVASKADYNVKLESIPAVGALLATSGSERVERVGFVKFDAARRRLSPSEPGGAP